MTKPSEITPGPASGGPTELYPVLPLRDIVVFPHMIVPLFVGREKSIKALEVVMRDDKQILLATQKDAADDNPSVDAIYSIGTLASVLQLLKLPDGTVKVLVEGGERARILNYTDNDEYFEAAAEVLEEAPGDEHEIEALARSVTAQFESYVKLNKKVPPEVLGSVTSIEDHSKLADTVASHLAIKITEKQELLEIPSVGERLERIYSLMEAEISVLQVEKKIRSRVKRQMEKTQREYYLNEQMKAIQGRRSSSPGGGWPPARPAAGPGREATTAANRWCGRRWSPCGERPRHRVARSRSRWPRPTRRSSPSRPSPARRNLPQRGPGLRIRRPLERLPATGSRRTRHGRRHGGSRDARASCRRCRNRSR